MKIENAKKSVAMEIEWKEEELQKEIERANEFHITNLYDPETLISICQRVIFVRTQLEELKRKLQMLEAIEIG